MARVKPHPGEMLQEEFLVPLNMSARQLADAINVPSNRISELIRGRRALTADTALRLGRYFRTSAEMWMNMQTAYELSCANHDIVAHIVPRAA